MVTPCLPSPKAIDYYVSTWTQYLEDASRLPRMQGSSVSTTIQQCAEAMNHQVPRDWRSEQLRFCERCMALGIHLRIQQHLAVEVCPLHDGPLRTTCPACQQPLPFRSGSQQAFRCPACGGCLLANDELRFGFSSRFRRKVREECEEVSAWLALVNAGTHRGLDRFSGSFQVKGGLDHIHEKAFLLTGLQQPSKRVPTWMHRPRSLAADVSIGCIAPCANSLSSAIHSSRNVSRWAIRPNDVAQDDPLRNVSAVLALGHDAKTRYIHAFRRVARQFLRMVRAQHGDCLKSAPLMALASNSLDGEIHPEMLLCCPVALGFWLWRRRGSEFFPYYSWFSDVDMKSGDVDVFTAGADLLFYAIERSDLHASIVIASECARYLEITDDVASAMKVVRAWEGARRHYEFSQPALFSPVGRDVGVTFVRVDASRLIRSSSCPGLVPYHEVLRSRLRSAPYLNRAANGLCYVNAEDCWPERAARHLDLIAPREERWAWGRTCNPVVHLAMLGTSSTGVDESACVTAAIAMRPS